MWSCRLPGRHQGRNDGPERTLGSSRTDEESVQTCDVSGRAPHRYTPGRDCQPEGRLVGPLRDKYLQHTAAVTTVGPTTSGPRAAPARQPPSPSAAACGTSLCAADLRRWDISTRSSASAIHEGASVPSRSFNRWSSSAGACRSPTRAHYSSRTSPSASMGGRTPPRSASGYSTPPGDCHRGTAPLTATQARTPDTPDSSTVGAISIPSSPAAEMPTAQSLPSSPATGTEQGPNHPGVPQRSMVLRLDTASSNNRDSSARYPISPTDLPSGGSSPHKVWQRMVPGCSWTCANLGSSQRQYHLMGFLMCIVWFTGRRPAGGVAPGVRAGNCAATDTAAGAAAG